MTRPVQPQILIASDLAEGDVVFPGRGGLGARSPARENCL